jgi:hypothetical protein
MKSNKQMKKTNYKKLKFSECAHEIQKEVLKDIERIKWKEGIDGHRSKIIVTFKNEKYYGFGLI